MASKKNRDRAEATLDSMSFEQAERNHKMWHQKAPRETIDVSFDFPARVFRCGKMVSVIYESDKWEKDGDFYPYEHDFDSRPPVYCPKSFRKMNPGSSARQVANLLCVSDINGNVPMTLLALVEEIVVDHAGKLQKYTFKDPPVMAGTPDNRTLVIFCKGGPVFVSGSRMRITERAIVH